MPLLPTGFVPPSDRGQTQINIELPPGVDAGRRPRAVAERRAWPRCEDRNVTGVFSSIGGGSSGDAFAPGAAAEARRAVLTLTHHAPQRPRMNRWRDIERGLRSRLDAIPGARFTVGPADTGVKMQLVLRSEDPVALSAAAQQVDARAARPAAASATSAPAPRWCARKSSCVRTSRAPPNWA